MHDWVTGFMPGVGWVEFDPSSGLVPSDGPHTLAWGREYEDAGPSRGVLIGGQSLWMDVSGAVVPI